MTSPTTQPHPLLKNIRLALAGQGLDPALRRVHLVVACSGGPDSTALLHALCDWRDGQPENGQKIDLQLTVAWVNHAWRETPQELPILHQHVLARNVPWVMIACDKTLPKTEGAARTYRYEQLTKLAAQLQADAVVTAHHADDQVETILFRILRGTGLDGLTGVRKKLLFKNTTVPVVRPMIDTARGIVENYLRENNLKSFEDPSNNDVKYQRNLIRKKILPQLQQDFPQVKNALFKLALVVEGDMQIVETHMETLWERVACTDDTGLFLKAGVFSQMDVPYQRRIIKRFLQHHSIGCDFQLVEETLTFIRGDHRRKISSALKSLPCDVPDKKNFLSLYKDLIRVLTLPARQVEEGLNIDISQPGIYPIPDAGLEIETRLLPPNPDKTAANSYEKSALAELWIDPELGGFKDKPLQLRTRQPGDKFHPAGMPVPLRLKRWLINRAIPRFDRDKIPVLACGEHVLWAKDMGISMVPMSDPYKDPSLVVIIRKQQPEGVQQPEEVTEPVPEEEKPVVAMVPDDGPEQFEMLSE